MKAQLNTGFPGQLTSSPTMTCQENSWLNRAAVGLDFSGLLARFEPISLDEMADVALLKRTEIKYVMSEAQLYEALAALRDDYRVLDIQNNRLNYYQTLYFDTADFALYLRHHAGGRNRYKIRSRSYVDTDLSFFEIKHKINSNQTVKSRFQTGHLMTQVTPETGDFVQARTPLQAWRLEPKLWNEYFRITLVSRRRPERLTLDLNVQFSRDGETAVLPGIVIAEVKQNGNDRSSDFVRQMRAMNVHPNGFSKYCIGVSLLYPELKHNNFKPKLRLVNKLMQEDHYVH